MPHKKRTLSEYSFALSVLGSKLGSKLQRLLVLYSPLDCPAVSVDVILPQMLLMSQMPHLVKELRHLDLLQELLSASAPVGAPLPMLEPPRSHRSTEAESDPVTQFSIRLNVRIHSPPL